MRTLFAEKEEEATYTYAGRDNDGRGRKYKTRKRKGSGERERDEDSRKKRKFLPEKGHRMQTRPRRKNWRVRHKLRGEKVFILEETTGRKTSPTPKLWGGAYGPTVRKLKILVGRLPVGNSIFIKRKETHKRERKADVRIRKGRKERPLL